MALHIPERALVSFERASAAFVILLVIVGLVTVIVGLVLVNTGAPTISVFPMFVDPHPTGPSDGVIPAS